MDFWIERADDDPVDWFAIVVIGMGVGFLAGLFGKGGSAIATPLLHAVGVPAIVALAAPLPATIPSTSAGAFAYWRAGFIDRRVLRWSVACGVPATAAGALASRWVGGGALIIVTDVLIAALGIRFLVAPGAGPAPIAAADDPISIERIAAVAVMVGLASGLLANSGGFLLAPLYMAVLRLPIKPAFASSLAVAAVLALPGTAVHWALGHLDWSVVAVFAVASVPLSYAGARLGLRSDAQRLERWYGAALTTLGLAFVIAAR